MPNLVSITVIINCYIVSGYYELELNAEDVDYTEDPDSDEGRTTDPSVEHKLTADRNNLEKSSIEGNLVEKHYESSSQTMFYVALCTLIVALVFLVIAITLAVCLLLQVRKVRHRHRRPIYSPISQSREFRDSKEPVEGSTATLHIQNR